MAKAKKIVGLDCDAEAAIGITRILTTRFEEMLEHRAAPRRKRRGNHSPRRFLKSALRGCVFVSTRRLKARSASRAEDERDAARRT